MSKEIFENKAALPELENKRYPYIGIFGATGSGKSELGRLLNSEWGIRVFEEEYPENPFLAKFYLEDPKLWSLKSQLFFATAKIKQMRAIPPLLFKGMLWHDPALEADRDIYAYVQHEMEFMSPEEYLVYHLDIQTQIKALQLPKPDMLFAVDASDEAVCRRIMLRGREMEINFMRRFPDYFPRLAQRARQLMRENPYSIPMEVINTDEWNYVDNPEHRQAVLGKIKNSLITNLFNRQIKNGQGQDGAEVIFPPEVFQMKLPSLG